MEDIFIKETHIISMKGVCVIDLDCYSLANLSSAILKPSFFRTTNYEAFKDVNPRRVQGTCQWVLSHPHFLEWQSSDTSRLLWVSGDPGCGKSTLSKALVDEKLVIVPYGHTQVSSYVHYYFFKDVGEQSNATSALCALLHQLFCHDWIWKRCFEVVKTAFDNEGSGLTKNFQALWKLLIQATNIANVNTKVVYVLDGLDECEEVQRRKLIEELEHLLEDPSACSAKFLVTSRPYQRILYDFQEMISRMPTIHLAGEEESEKLETEIDLVVDSRVSAIGFRMGFSQLIIERLKERLKIPRQRTYLWLSFILEELQQLVAISDDDVLRQIDRLPLDLEAAYDNMLRKSPDKSEAKRLLTLTCIAKRPLKVFELELLARVRNLGDPTLHADVGNFDRFKRYLRHVCGLLLVVIDGNVFLIHQTAKEYLMAQNSVTTKTLGWKGCIINTEANEQMARQCMLALPLLSLAGPRDLDRLIGKPYYYNTDVVGPTILARDAQISLHYAVVGWRQHLLECNFPLQNSTITALRFLFEQFSLSLQYGDQVFLDCFKIGKIDASYDFPLNKLAFGKAEEKTWRGCTNESEVRMQWVRGVLREILRGKAHNQPNSPLSDAYLFACLAIFDLKSLFDDFLTQSGGSIPMPQSIADFIAQTLILHRSVAQLRAFLLMPSILRLSNIHLTCALPVFHFEQASSTLHLLFEAGVTLKHEARNVFGLCLITDVEVLLNAGLDPYGDYLENLSRVQNEMVFKELAFREQTRARFFAAFARHRICPYGKYKLQTKLYTSARPHFAHSSLPPHSNNPLDVSSACGTINDHLVSALYQAAVRENQISCHYLFELIKSQTSTAALCSFCYAFSYFRGTDLFNTVLNAYRYRFFINEAQSKDPRMCSGLGPLVYPAIYHHVGIGARLLHDHGPGGKAHRQPWLKPLRWASLFSVLHDNIGLLDVIIRYVDGRAGKLQLGPNSTHIPDDLRVACLQRKKLFDAKMQTYQPDTSASRLNNTILYWTFAATTTLVKNTELVAIPRYIFDDEAADRLRFCMRNGGFPGLVVAFHAYVKSAAATDERFQVLMPHVEELVVQKLGIVTDRDVIRRAWAQTNPSYSESDKDSDSYSEMGEGSQTEGDEEIMVVD